MRFVIQRVSSASVDVDGKTIGKIGRGFLVLIGVCDEDTEETCAKMVKKMLGLRIFPDSEGKTNLDLDAVDGEVLLISQFTLYADCRHGNRPSFIKAGSPDHAEKLYDHICSLCSSALGEKNGKNRAERGSFGADMKVSLVNDGPFTIDLDSEDLR